MTHHHRIAFGSCNEQDKVNHLWPVIESREPVAFVWGGDAIYADKNLGIQFDRFPPSFPAKHATPQRLKTLYRKQRQVPGYKRIIDKNITIFGTLDGTCVRALVCGSVHYTLCALYCACRPNKKTHFLTMIRSSFVIYIHTHTYTHRP